jgi:hypothetical protein
MCACVCVRAPPVQTFHSSTFVYKKYQMHFRGGTNRILKQYLEQSPVYRQDSELVQIIEKVSL